MTILDRYFELSDEAGGNEEAFQDLMNLFTEHAVLHSASGERVVGKKALEQFFVAFFEKNRLTRHVWTTTNTDNGLCAAWAVAGIRRTGQIFALKGVDTAQLDENGKIKFLEVQFDK